MVHIVKKLYFLKVVTGHMELEQKYWYCQLVFP